MQMEPLGDRILVKPDEDEKVKIALLDNSVGSDSNMSKLRACQRQGAQFRLRYLLHIQVTAGGLVMSSGSTKAIQDAVIGEVLAVGGEVDIKVKAGDKILYSKYSTSDVSVPDGEVTFVAQKSVLATLS